MTVVAIHQPQYLPWIGYFDKLDQSDVFCLLDTVQYKKNEYQNRNRIKNDRGWQWLTVPVTYRFPQKIRDVAVHSRVPWGRAHIQAMKTHYRKAPYYDRYADRFVSLWEKEWRFLADVNIAFLQLLLEVLGLQCRVVSASRLPVKMENPTGRLIEITRLLGGDAYLSGSGAEAYLEKELFRVEKVTLWFQRFRHPVYPQCYGPFLPNMSLMDLVFNCGPSSLSILRESRQAPAREES